jgi:germination protein M
MGRRNRTLVAAVVLVALSVLGCGGPGASPLPSIAPTAEAPTDPPGSAPVDAIVVDAWFLIGEKLAVVRREVPRTDAVLRAAVEELLRGITFADASYGLTTAIPDGTVLRGVDLDGGTATVDLSSTFESGGGSLSMMARMAQLVFTATQFPTVDRVVLRLDGEPVEWIGGEGLVVAGPQTRRDYEGMSGAIVVESPGVGDAVTGPLRVTGEANVFEAVVSLELRDAAGRVLVDTTTMATAGTGTWGRYRVDLVYPPTSGRLELEVYAVSPKDGSRIERVVYPLEASGGTD